MASLQPVFTDLLIGVQHSGKEMPKNDQLYLIQAKMPSFSNIYPKTERNRSPKRSQSHTLTCVHRGRFSSLLPDSDSDVTARFERVKSWHTLKFKFPITVRYLNTADIRKGLISLNSHSELIHECKSN